MRRFGWMRLACLFFVLTVLAALIRLGDGGAEARSLATRVPDTMFFASERPEEPTATPRTEAQISSLEDLSEDALQMDDGAGPAPRTTRTSGTEERRPPARERARPVPPSEPPVFYRPASPRAPVDSRPICGGLRGAPEGGKIVFPLERRYFSSYEDTWGAPRAQGGHEGTDLMAPSGIPEYAITDGTVVPVAGSNSDGWNTLGGHAVMIRADYSMGPVEAGDLFYYAHLERETPLRIGTRVSAGQVVGYAGDTGQGPPGTSGLFPPHLHLGWYDGTGGREEAPSGAMNPYPLLEWIKSNGGAVTGDSEARFCEAPRAGPTTPSAHDGTWPSPTDPDLSPDLDTDPGNPKPNRATQKDESDVEVPARKPSTPDRPEKTRHDILPKNPGDDRPQAPKHDRPDKDKQEQKRPDPHEGHPPPPKPNPPEKDPPKKGSPEEDPPEPAPPEPTRPASQYDPSTDWPASMGKPANPAEKPHPGAGQEPEADRKPTPDERTGRDLRDPSSKDR